MDKLDPKTRGLLLATTPRRVQQLWDRLWSIHIGGLPGRVGERHAVALAEWVEASDEAIGPTLAAAFAQWRDLRAHFGGRAAAVPVEPDARWLFEHRDESTRLLADPLALPRCVPGQSRKAREAAAARARAAAKPKREPPPRHEPMTAAEHSRHAERLGREALKRLEAMSD